MNREFATTALGRIQPQPSFERLRKTNSLLLVLPLAAFRADSHTFIDAQARNGLRLWLDNFENLALACPTFDEQRPTEFEPIDDPRIKFIPLPAAYTPYRFAMAILRARHTLGHVIDNSEYLHFAIGGLFGDWGSISALIARGKGRTFAVWTDRVESQIAKFQAKSRRGPKKVYYSTIAHLTKYYERQIIKRSALGLFHGMDCFEAYSPFCSNPQLVHNVHLGKEKHIADVEIEERLTYSGPLRVAYAGRACTDKGIYDWIETLSELTRGGTEIRATWFGDGPELADARRVISQNSLSHQIQFVGAIDHEQCINALRSFDVFVFCHKTLESPRCLIEALICGLPLVGYDSPYPRNLIETNGGGLLSRPTPKALACAINAAKLQRVALTAKARKDGALFDADAVFRHRSELMKSFIHPSRRPDASNLNG